MSSMGISILLILLFGSLNEKYVHTELHQINVKTKSGNLRLIESLRIGESSDMNPDMILVRPRIVVAEKLGRIFIADEGILAVKVFDRKGSSITTIGRSGQGPGEFQSLTAMAINLQGQLVVADFINSRFTVFSRDGHLIATHKLNTSMVQWPRRIVCTPDSGYIVLAKHENHDAVFHRFSKNFRYIESFGKLPIINHKSVRFEGRFAEVEPGEISIDAKGMLYYVPGLFDGKIYRYQNNVLLDVLTTPISISPSYEYDQVEKFGPGPPPTKYQYSLGGPAGLFYARRNIILGGITILNDGTIAHLVVIFQGNEYTVGFQLLSPQGNFIDQFEFKNKKFPDYAWSTSSGRWYLINRIGVPEVIEYTLESQ